jgi:hypothetical protein
MLILWSALVAVEAGPSYWHATRTEYPAYDAVGGELRLAAGANAGRWSFFGTFRFTDGRQLGSTRDTWTVQMGAGMRVRLARVLRLGVDLGVGMLVARIPDVFGSPSHEAFTAASVEGVLEITAVQRRRGAFIVDTHLGGLFTFGDSLGERQVTTLSLGVGYRY